MNAQEILTTAQKSFVTLYDKYGIRPNAFMISESLLQILRNDIELNMAMTEHERNLMKTEASCQLYGVPVYPVVYPAGMIKATIITE